ncbi:hypothetical protein HDU87_005462 [Geranomyces variabilis]|uniref:L-ornithine N(5)-oxygenase n=1 Tax=Geranomyces variabilis TaxID=109894 RepID=A0AAD5THL7_9FUNG|nr:hypothetical protein HDU87_005462 [Geranomyces variabilis]
MHELIVIGAGPHAMSLLSALLETRPDKYLEHPDNGLLFYRPRGDAADWTRTSQTLMARDSHYHAARRQKKAEADAVKAVLQAVGKTGARAQRQTAYRAPTDGDLDDRVRDVGGQRLFHQRSGMQSPLAWLTARMTVLDKQDAPPADCCGRHKLGAWMPLWRTQMKFLNVQHLRSPVSHHPDAIDRFILWQYAMAQGYSSELDLIPLHIPRDATYSGPFLLPSSDLFWEYCGRVIVQGFALERVTQQGEVVRVVPVACRPRNPAEDDECGVCDHFSIHLRGGQVVTSRNVVLATGSSSAERRMPEWVQALHAAHALYPPHVLVHCSDLAIAPDRYLEPLRRRSPGLSDAEGVLNGRKIVIIGGGLTSIHLSRVALDLGSRDVTLISRSNLSIQPFDVDVEWVGPRRAKRMAAFWSDRDPASRASRLRSARFPSRAPCECGTGASITSEGLALLDVALENGSMKILERIQIVNAKWVATSDEATDSEWLLQLSNSQRLACDAVWLATGAAPNAETDPLLRDICHQHPIEMVNGMPSLRPDLSWSRKCPGLFVMGPLAALEVGPGAPNLMGGRLAAGRIVPSLRERLDKAYMSGI